MNRRDLILATIRTAVPAAVGWVLAYAIAHIPAVADVVARADALLAAVAPGQTVSIILSGAVIGLVTGAYYWLARRIGHRWPAAEKWLLGRSATPTYAEPESVTTEDPDPNLDSGAPPEQSTSGD